MSAGRILTIEQQNRQADIWEEKADGTMYMGYALPSTNGTNEKRFLIVKIEPVSSTVSKRLYPNGSTAHNQSWDDREDLTYKFGN